MEVSKHRCGFLFYIPMLDPTKIFFTTVIVKVKQTSFYFCKGGRRVFWALGDPSGTINNLSLMVKYAFWHSPAQSRGSLSLPLRVSYKGLAMSPTLGIQSQKNPAIPRNPCNCLWVVGITTLSKASLWSRSKILCPWDNSNPKYLALDWEIWALFFDILYPRSARKLRGQIVFLSEAFLVLLVIKMLSTYWSKVPPVTVEPLGLG